jgi:hypothetical protein
MTDREIETSTNYPTVDIPADEMQKQLAAQQQVAEDIARLKALGKSIYYTIGEKLVEEKANGQKIEYAILADGSKVIIGEIV